MSRSQLKKKNVFKLQKTATNEHFVQENGNLKQAPNLHTNSKCRNLHRKGRKLKTTLENNRKCADFCFLRIITKDGIIYMIR